MTSELVNLSPDARQRVDAYLDAIERVLVAADMPRPERKAITDDVEAQILDMLATRAGTEAALGAFVEVGSSDLQAILICVAIFLKLAVWIAAIIDAAATPLGWYANYPNMGWWDWDYPE